MVRTISLPAILAAALIVAPTASASAQKANRTTSAAKKTTASKAIGSKAGAWRAVFDDTAVALSVDTVQTRRLADGTFSTRLRWQYKTDRPIGRNESYRTLVERRMVNCASHGSKPMSGQTYDAAGKPVSNFSTAASDVAMMEWAVRKPGTSSANAYDALCTDLQKK
jgi:hypothetical protein